MEGLICCFSGHRPEKLRCTESEAIALLKKEIEKSVGEGYKTFISGMARGSDIWAAKIVADLKKNYEIRLVCAVPYPGFHSGWKAGWKNEFESIIALADDVVYICAHYVRGCFHRRNEWMVDKSDKLIAVYCGAAGGTRNTIRYAERKRLKIVNVLEEYT